MNERIFLLTDNDFLFQSFARDLGVRFEVLPFKTSDVKKGVEEINKEATSLSSGLALKVNVRVQEKQGVACIGKSFSLTNSKFASIVSRIISSELKIRNWRKKASFSKEDRYFLENVKSWALVVLLCLGENWEGSDVISAFTKALYRVWGYFEGKERSFAELFHYYQREVILREEEITQLRKRLGFSS